MVACGETTWEQLTGWWWTFCWNDLESQIVMHNKVDQYWTRTLRVSSQTIYSSRFLLWYIYLVNADKIVGFKAQIRNVFDCHWHLTFYSLSLWVIIEMCQGCPSYRMVYHIVIAYDISSCNKQIAWSHVRRQW